MLRRINKNNAPGFAFILPSNKLLEQSFICANLQNGIYNSSDSNWKHTIFACPAAAITMSASRIMLSGLEVWECTMVTVASAFRRRRDTGNPTILLRPTTTALLPFILIPLRVRSSRHPWNEKICLVRTIFVVFLFFGDSGNCYLDNFVGDYLRLQVHLGCRADIMALCPSLPAFRYLEGEIHQHLFQY